MGQLAACTLLLPLLLLGRQYGLSGQEKLLLRTLPSDADQIACTGDLVCEKSEMWCVPSDMVTAEYPVLVPSSIQAETLRKCRGDFCSLCVQLTVNMSVAFLTEYSYEELGSADCDNSQSDEEEEESEEEWEEEIEEDYEVEEEEEEGQKKKEAHTVNVYLRLNSSNGSYICGYLFISSSSYSCQTMRVSLPVSSVAQMQNSSSLAVGSIVYSCLDVAPSTEMFITSFTNPRYSNVINTTYEVPGCLDLQKRNNIWVCGDPTLDLIDGTSVGIVNGTDDRTVTVGLYYDYDVKSNSSLYTLAGRQRLNISQSDIVPCLCITAWYNDLIDGVRSPLWCPFKNYSDDRTLSKSKLELRNNKLAVYSLEAFCNVTAEAFLCWKSTDQSDCREIPNTRRTIVSKVKYPIEGLALAHPSLCVQVMAKGKILHTECLNSKEPPLLGTEAVLVYERKRISVCQMEAGGCKVLYDATHQLKRKLEFLEERLVEDAMTDQCVRLLNGTNQDVFICSPDKYMRSRWTWSRVLCLLIVATVLLVLLLKNEDLKRWLKSLTTEKSLGEIFKERPVLIFYSPDSPAYEELVRVFASSLKELSLGVVLDQWHRTEMSQIGPLAWYQNQKSHILKKGGLIILLLSEGAQERYTAWKDEKSRQISDSDPYGTFGAVLNCIYSDFDQKKAKGSYLVACFDFSDKEKVVQAPFTALRTHTLPSHVVHLLHELAGDNAKKLSGKQAKRLSTAVSDQLKAPMQAWRTNMLRQTESEKLNPAQTDEEIAVELQRLV